MFSSLTQVGILFFFFLIIIIPESSREVISTGVHERPHPWTSSDTEQPLMFSKAVEYHIIVPEMEWRPWWRHVNWIIQPSTTLDQCSFWATVWSNLSKIDPVLLEPHLLVTLRWVSPAVRKTAMPNSAISPSVNAKAYTAHASQAKSELGLGESKSGSGSSICM